MIKLKKSINIRSVNNNDNYFIAYRLDNNTYRIVQSEYSESSAYRSMQILSNHDNSAECLRYNKNGFTYYEVFKKGLNEIID